MHTKALEEFAGKMNSLAQEEIPFFFMVDYECERPILIPLEELEERGILTNLNPSSSDQESKHNIEISAQVEAYSSYNKKFEKVLEQIKFGNSYLCNLTSATPITLSHELIDIYYNVQSKYKILYQDQFLCFSPETFVQIKDGIISSYPMKGTMDASIKNAEEELLKSKKEKAEHNTIVDLIRNDLSMISSQVEVKRFRYIDRIQSNGQELLQTSSEICGQLPKNYREKIGSILCSLLPAGSISGAPKRKTLEIIEEVEAYKRAYYTGVAGVFQNGILDSFVLIRFIEKNGDSYFYKSGGGITKFSDAQSEYNELKQKIYVPTL